MIVLTDVTGEPCLVEEQAMLYTVAGQSVKDRRGSTLVFGHELFLGVVESPMEILERIAETYQATGEYEYEDEDEDEEEVEDDDQAGQDDA